MENVIFKSLQNIPDWVNFLAIDANGEMWGYENKPEINIPVDEKNIHECYWVEYSENGEIELLSKFDNYSADWKDSLIERQKA